ncbi:hypothetical protein ACWGJT_33485 [Streptomyces xantholiticus]|nr:hypothetical protein CGZ69_23475 [Streptomyces peucetius subsp. caesius ATCC 27952]
MEHDTNPHPERPGGDDGIVCAGCGKVAEEMPVTWTFSVEKGVRHHLCDDCARANIRAIEGRLDSQWW